MTTQAQKDKLIADGLAVSNALSVLAADITALAVDAPPTNVALASAGAIASASSLFAAGYSVAALNDGKHDGIAGAGGVWAGASGFPQWAQIDFSGSKNIDRVVVSTAQDAYATPVNPDDVMKFTKFGIVDFTVQGWNGTVWIVLATVAGNDLVKRTIPLPPTVTSAIRIHVTKAADDFARIAEIEAWGFDSGTVVTPTTPPAVYVPPTLNYPPLLALIVGAPVQLGQYVVSALPYVWTPLDTPLVSLTAAGVLTGKAVGSATPNVEIDDGH